MKHGHTKTERFTCRKCNAQVNEHKVGASMMVSLQVSNRTGPSITSNHFSLASSSGSTVKATMLLVKLFFHSLVRVGFILGQERDSETFPSLILS